MLDIEDFKKSIGNKSRLLGIDPGKKRIGLAISDEDKLVSTPLKTILKKKIFDFIKEIKEIIEENNIKVFGPNKIASQLEGSKAFMKNKSLINLKPSALMSQKLSMALKSKAFMRSK